MFWGLHGLDKINATGSTRSMSLIRTIRLDSLGPIDVMVLDLSWFTVLACSIVFFFCFATSEP
jgi:pheromone a factor receptor